jgi:gelsolin
MPEKISWMDTNLALIGSELDHKVKEAAAQGEEAWDGIGTKKGLIVWRVENFTIQPWPEERYGALTMTATARMMNEKGLRVSKETCRAITAHRVPPHASTVFSHSFENS